MKLDCYIGHLHMLDVVGVQKIELRDSSEAIIISQSCQRWFTKTSAEVQVKIGVFNKRININLFSSVRNYSFFLRKSFFSINEFSFRCKVSNYSILPTSTQDRVSHAVFEQRVAIADIFYDEEKVGVVFEPSLSKTNQGVPYFYLAHEYLKDGFMPLISCFALLMNHSSKRSSSGSGYSPVPM